MKLVVDANVLFGFFKRESKTRELILDPELEYELELFAPELVLDEIGRHKSDICSRFGLNPKDFDELFSALNLFIKVVKKQDFEEFIPEAKKIFSEHLKDVPYVALVLWLKESGMDIALWSEEDRLEDAEKEGIKVYKTSKLLKEFGSI